MIAVRNPNAEGTGRKEASHLDQTMSQKFFLDFGFLCHLFVPD